MRRRKNLFYYITLLFITLLIMVMAKNTLNWKQYKISRVLKNKYYSYLPQEAKDYIKNVYEETGEIIKTEKNKQDNIPYISPKYIDYLELSEEEKKNVDEIPQTYAIEFSSDGSTESLPSKYDLRNVNGNQYISNLKNQKTSNLCWSFASIEQIESNLMVKNNSPFNSSSLLFSPRQIDYATSTGGIKDYNNENGIRELLTEGGNFLATTFILYNGLGLTSESQMPFNISTSKKELNEVMNYNNSLYEVNSSIMMPTMTSNNTEAEWNDYISTIKELVMENGGAYVGTQGPGYSCSSINSDGNTIIRVDDSCDIEEAGHAMQIIGWDDDYTYKYCKNNGSHASNISNCSSSNLVTGKGAWIARNSWGNNYPYVYLAFDSVEENVYIFTSMSEMSTRTWDNNYHKKLNPFLIYYNIKDTQSFTKTIDSKEKVEKVKFYSFGKGGVFNLSINTGEKEYNNIKTVTVPYPGIYTIDVSDSNIILDSESFEVEIKSTNRVNLVKESISVFTSNVDDSPIIKTHNNNITLDSSDTNYSFRIYSSTKNISPNEEIQYQLLNEEGIDLSNYLTTANNKVAKNDINTQINISPDVKIGQFKIKLSYQEATEEVGLKVEARKPVIYYYSNYDSNFYSQTLTSSSNQLEENRFTRTGYTFTGWNTERDGSGTSYENLQEVNDLENDLVLYAQWIPNTYTITYNANTGTGEMESQIFTYGEILQLEKNSFIKEGYVFKNWNTKADGTGIVYKDLQTIDNLLDNIVLYAQWEKKSITISYDANSGIGQMQPQKTYYGESIRTAANRFTKEGHTFKEWNTKPDGSGQNYSENQLIENITDNITLYAKWTPNKYTVTFNANGGTGEMGIQEFTYGVSQALQQNIYTREEYRFKEWNTKADGTGNSYTDEQIINISSNIKLYAIWIGLRVSLSSNPESINYGEVYSNFNNVIEKKVTIENTGNVSVKLNITNPTNIGPFGSVNFENGKVLKPNEKYLVSLIVNPKGTYHNQPGSYNGTYIIAASSIEDNDNKYNLEIPAKLVIKKIPMAITYQTHVENLGWQTYRKNGEMAGTSGKALRLEGIRIKLENQDYPGDIEYRTHVENLGWQEYVSNGAMAGTSGKAFRLEAINIRLTGEMKEQFDVYYRVHAENFGWLGWARNDEEAGTAGYGFRLEAIEIKLLKKGNIMSEYGQSVAFKDKYPVKSISLNKKSSKLEVGDEDQLQVSFNPTNASNKKITWSSSNESIVTVDDTGKIVAHSEGNTKITATSKNGKTDTCSVEVTKAVPGVEYQTHVENLGWQTYRKNGEMAGTSGRSFRLEAIKIRLRNKPYDGDIEYKTHIQNLGWEKLYKKNDDLSGTEGRAFRLEAIQIKLTGEMEKHFDVYYRVHAENFGWLGWARNDEKSGTAGYGFRLEAIEIKLVEKNKEYLEYGQKVAFREKK